MISVIVPVYNVSAYLRRCVDSILAQTYSELEVILVNDGSTDDCLGICKYYEALDNRIVLIDQKNQGVSVARNRGLAIARGRWISFVDADDYLDLDFYEILIEGTKKTESEVVCCGVRPVNENGVEVPHLQTKRIPTTAVSLNMDRVYRHFLGLEERFIYWSPFDKIYRADIAKKIRFEVGRKRAEDFFYCFNFFQYCSSLYYIPEKKYNYFQRSDSVTHMRNFDESQFDPVDLSKKVLSILSSGRASETVVELSQQHYIVQVARLVKSFYQYGGDEKVLFQNRVINERNELKCQMSSFMKMPIRFAVLCFFSAFFPQLFKIRKIRG
ncbi:Glycosyltransferase involved in cell wall bisynthesis [Fibrobacter sp. UWH5]|uniref:glycosyltransferase n=1 Tax=Fibrobacter sp. UWH5 TaxID=1896211 RepID=UPI0009202CC0|nr:glycosyltransferase [Fibrobacter sp. UWH5]SHL04927.1 Glycosyltransferase involved in cell wall bisynthesis [Fibrobacter sp. UWH5]